MCRFLTAHQHLERRCGTCHSGSTINTYHRQNARFPTPSRRQPLKDSRQHRKQWEWDYISNFNVTAITTLVLCSKLGNSTETPCWTEMHMSSVLIWDRADDMQHSRAHWITICHQTSMWCQGYKQNLGSVPSHPQNPLHGIRCHQTFILPLDLFAVFKKLLKMHFSYIALSGY